MKTELTPEIESRFAFQLQQLHQEGSLQPEGTPPIITISRQFGCQGYQLAYALAEQLSTPSTTWNVYGKDLLEASPESITLREHLIRQIQTLNRDAFEQLAEQWLAQKPTNYQLYKHLLDDLTIISQRGHVIVVGVAAALMLKHRPMSFHVRIFGSHEKRVRRLAHHYGLSLGEAAHVLDEGVEARERFIRELVKENAHDFTHYDLICNNDVMTIDEMCDETIRGASSKFIKRDQPVLSYLKKAL